MATQYTSLLGLALPVTGELSGTWGDTVNTAITSLLDSAVAGTTTLSADTDVTLTTTTGVANQARQAIILWTANGSVTRNVTAPAQSKIYTVINASAGTQSIVIRGAGPTTGVTIIKGESAQVAWNGSDFVKISNTGGSASFTNVTVSGTTTLSGLTASTALALNGSKEVVSVTNTGTGNNVLSASPTLTGTVAGASLQLSSLTSGRVTYAGASGLLQDSANLTFNGTDLTVSGAVNAGTINATTLDLTNLEVTNIKAKDGTAGMQIADSTGVVSFTANPVISGGTANGVAYLNGSKVLTTGSALTFDGSFLNLSRGSAGTLLNLTDAVAQTFRVATTASTVNLDSASGGSLAFLIGSAEQMRLTSTGLGIGTSSPSYKLDIANATYARLTTTTYSNGGLINARTALSGGTYNTFDFVEGSTTTGYLRNYGSVFGAGVDNHLRLWNTQAAPITFGTSDTERMRLDSSGNLGLGVTPSAWGSGFPALQLGNYGAFIVGRNNTNQLFIGSNAYFNGTNWIYANTASSSRYYQSAGSHVWDTAPSGTAGNAISFTQAMTLDASGNLGIGTSSIPTVGSTTVLAVGNANGGTHAIVQSGSIVYRTSASTSGVDCFNPNASPISWYTSGSERMRLDASGNLGIGTSSPAAKIESVATISGLSGWFMAGQFTSANYPMVRFAATTPNKYSSIGNDGDGSLQFFVNGSSTGLGSNAAMLNPSGNLGLGVTPSAWAGVNPVFEFGGTGVSASLFQNGVNDTWFSSNAYFNGSSFIYKATGTATQYHQNGGAHKWFSAPSGTAGNAISFSQVMTLNASGQLAVGTTSPTSGALLTLQESASNSAALSLKNRNSTQTWSIAVDAAAVDDKILAFIDPAAGQVRMSLTDTGNLGLGVTPSAWGSFIPRAIELPNGVGFASQSNAAVGHFSANAYYDGSWRYKANGVAARYALGSDTHAWYTAASGTAGNAISFTQAMTLTAAGRLGIGTTAPQQTLHAYGNIEFGGTSTPFLYSHRNAVISGAVSLGNIEFAGDTATTSLCLSASIRAFADGAWTDSSYPSNLRFLTTSSGSTDPTERMRLSSDGNLGLGVTPSAWATLRGLQVGNASIAGFQNFAYLNSNAFYDGSAWKYISNGFAAKYDQVNSVHAWYTAASGTAGNNISFTQAMTLDAGGRLGVGTTSPAARIHGEVAAATNSNVELMRLTDSVYCDFKVLLDRQTSLGSSISRVNTAAGNMAFETGNTERARIDSSGNLLVGTTTAYGRVVGKGVGAGNPGMVAIADTVSIEAIGVWNQATSGDNLLTNFGTEGTFTSRGSITYNRSAGLVVYNTTSDYRAKDIIGPVTDSGALIDATPVYMGKMKGATQERPMFIAHETPAYAHTGEKDAVDADGNPVYQQMDASALVPVMWAEIQSLRQRLAAAGI